MGRMSGFSTAQSENTGMVMVDTRALAAAAKQLRETAPAGWAAARKGLAAAGELIKADAASRSSYSSRIPASLRVRVTGGGIVKVVAGGSSAPNAAPIENHGRGFVRHPVFIPRAQLPGPPGRWTAKNSHPAYLTPALHDNVPAVEKLVDAAIGATLERMLSSGRW